MSKKPIPLSAACPACGVAFTPRYSRSDRADQVFCSRRCSDASLFWAHVEKSEGCWNWTGARQKSGYGTFRTYSHGKRNAHRYSWFFTHGQMPARDVDVCHRCDNRLCVRPEHLFLGTRLDNMVDAVNKGRMRRGESRRDCKLTDAEVAAIRSSPIPNNSEVARAYGVTPSLVWGIRHGNKRVLVQQE